MKLSAREDIEAPVAYVFGAATDFDAFERSALRRGADVRRVDTKTQKGVGMKWVVAFPYRGKPRELRAELTSYDDAHGLICKSKSGGFSGVLTIDLVVLSRMRTRMNVTLDIKPETLSARLLLQSLKLARGSLTRRFDKRVGHFAADVEAAFKATRVS